jgi:hypothetical protein
LAQFTQQGPKLVGTGAVGTQVYQGQSVSLSADGNTALVGGGSDNSGPNGAVGAAWVFTRINGVWTQQGAKLIGSDAAGLASQGVSVALSADGNTAIVGGHTDFANSGAAWVYTRSNGAWTQQGTKVVGTGAVGPQVFQGAVAQAHPVRRGAAASSPSAAAPTSAASPCAGLSTAGEPVDLAERLFGPRFLKPPLPAIVPGRERPGLAFLRYGACAEPSMEPTPRLAGHRPLAAEAMTVAHAGVAALFVFAMRAGLCHRRDLFDADGLPHIASRRVSESRVPKANLPGETGTLLLGATDRRASTTGSRI